MKNNPDTNNKLLSYLLIIKSFIVKFTFLAMIIKIFKRFAILKRIWSIFSTILFSIFGITLIDFYEIDALSKIFHKIIDIFTNFYANLSNLFMIKKNPVEFPSRIGTMERIQSETIGIQKGNENSDRIIERFTKLINKSEDIPIQEEINIPEENKPFYQSRLFIYGSLILISGITYYYCAEISSGASSLWNWLRGRKPDNPPINPVNPEINPLNSDSNVQTIKNWLDKKFSWNQKTDIAKKFNWNQKTDSQKLESLTNKNEIISALLDDDDVIEVTASSSNPIDKYFKEDKGKEIIKSPVLTSPSLENLNNQAQEGWSKSRSTSPISTSSNSSVETIKPPTSSSNTPSISNIFKHDEIPKSLVEETLDKAFFEDGTIKPFLGNPNDVGKLTNDNWLSFVNPGIKARMDFIENTFYSDKPLTLDAAGKMAEEYAIIVKSYNALVEVYEINKPNFKERHFKIVKVMAYCMRGWLKEVGVNLFPNDKINIFKGQNLDSPKLIPKNFFIDD